ncbi:MAG: hypothetical protein GY946_23335, partial [bacterium]|nr:hypothetical protein [bacterium]
MTWLPSILVALLAGGVGLFAAAIVMAACIRWYEVSEFEGRAGYALVAVALLGGLAGIVIGLVTARLVPDSAPHAFLTALGLSWATVLALAGIGGGIAWSLADIPPRLDGQELMLDVEFKLPVDASWPRSTDAGEWYAELGALSGRPRRKASRGVLRTEDARREDDRWVVPASVHVFTTRGKRLLSVDLGHETDPGFLVPLPRRPGLTSLKWSRWEPQPPWPDTRVSYRFRVSKIEPPPPEPTRADEAAVEAAAAQERFDAMDPGMPIQDWLPWTRYGIAHAHRDAALTHIASRPTFREEMRTLMLAEDARTAEEVLRLVEHVPDASLCAPVADAGGDLATRLQGANAATPDEDPAFLGAEDVVRRFSAWMVAVRTLRNRCAGDHTPELGAILILARVRSDSRDMRMTVVRVASYYMQKWTGLAP